MSVSSRQNSFVINVTTLLYFLSYILILWIYPKKSWSQYSQYVVLEDIKLLLQRHLILFTFIPAVLLIRIVYYRCRCRCECRYQFCVSSPIHITCYSVTSLTSSSHEFLVFLVYLLHTRLFALFKKKISQKLLFILKKRWRRRIYESINNY